MNNRKFALLLVAAGIVPLLPIGAVAEESKLKCETFKGYKCDARSDGTLYNCRNVTTEKCTVVSGPGSGKTKAAAGTVIQPTTTTGSPKIPATTKPLTTSPASR